MSAARKRTARQDAPKPAPVKATLDPLPYPELVFALIMPAGADLPGHVPAALRKELEGYGYEVQDIRLSSLIQGALNKTYEGKPERDRMSGLMADGTRLRETVQRGDAVAILSVAEIRRRRKEALGGRSDHNAYILNSIKHPSELQTLRHIYGWGFFALSIYAPRAQRVDQLAEKITSTAASTLKDPRSVAEALVAVDEQEEGTRFGQNVRDAFPESDYFVDARSKPDVDREVKRFLELVFGHAFRTPSRDEYGMYHAKAGAMRSADLGRQVGAVIASESGDVIAVGCNDVPKAFGGLYWEGDAGDSRDFQKGIDSNAVFQERILTEILSRLQTAKWLAPRLQDKTVQQLVQLAERDRVLEKIQLGYLLEFGRAVHAEMSALMDAARRGEVVQ